MDNNLNKTSVIMESHVQSSKTLVLVTKIFTILTAINWLFLILGVLAVIGFGSVFTRMSGREISPVWNLVFWVALVAGVFLFMQLLYWGRKLDEFKKSVFWKVLLSCLLIFIVDLNPYIIVGVFKPDYKSLSAIYSLAPLITAVLLLIQKRKFIN
jgi:hypothetical protein